MNEDKPIALHSELANALTNLERFSRRTAAPIEWVPLSLMPERPYEHQSSDALFALTLADKSYPIDASLFRHFLAGIFYRLLVKELDGSMLIRCDGVFKGLVDCGFPKWRKIEQSAIQRVVVEGFRYLVRRYPMPPIAADDAVDWVIAADCHKIIDVGELLAVWDDEIERGQQNVSAAACYYAAVLFLNLIEIGVDDDAIPRKYGTHASNRHPQLLAWAMRESLPNYWMHALSMSPSVSIASCISRAFEIRQIIPR